MAATIPTVEPSRIRAGTTAQWIRALADYEYSDGWRLSYALRGPAQYNLTCAATATDSHLATIPSTAATLVAGDYVWQSTAASGTLRYLVAEGRVTVDTDLAALSPLTVDYDGRTDARKTLDAIEATITGVASAAQQSFTVGDRTLSKYSVADLLLLRDRYRTMVDREEAAERVANGLGASNRIRIRFGNG